MNPDTLFGGGLSPMLRGLLAPEEQDALRNQALISSGLAIAGGTDGLFPALQQGLQAGQQTYQQGAQNALVGARAQQDLAEIAATTAQQQRVLAARRKYPPMPDASNQDAVRQWVDSVLPLAIAAGDKEVLNVIGQIRTSLAPKTPTNTRPVEVDLGDRVELRDPVTNKVLVTLPKGAPPRDTAAGAEQREEMSRQRTFQREQQLATRFEQATKDYAEIARLTSTVFASANDPSAAGDLSLIFAYMKLLDPGSVVREGEFATAANTGSIPESVWGRYNKIVKGERLASTVREDFVDRSKRLVVGYKDRLKRIMRQYEHRARAANVDPSLVVYDYFEGLGDAPGDAQSSRPPLGSFRFGGQ